MAKKLKRFDNFSIQVVIQLNPNPVTLATDEFDSPHQLSYN